jgi:hypothetical protein
MKKFIITAGALVALVVPSAAMATQPSTPGGFGADRADYAHVYTGAVVGDIVSDRAGTNGEANQDHMDEHGYLPVESSLSTP